MQRFVLFKPSPDEGEVERLCDSVSKSDSVFSVSLTVILFILTSGSGVVDRTAKSLKFTKITLSHEKLLLNFSRS